MVSGRGEGERNVPQINRQKKRARVWIVVLVEVQTINKNNPQSVDGTMSAVGVSLVLLRAVKQV